MTDYLVIYEQAEDGGWGAHSPDLGGVFVVGETRNEVEELMRKAVGMYLDEIRASGQPIPEPRTVAGRVAA